MKTLTLSTLLLVIAIATSSFVLSRRNLTKESTKKIQNTNNLRVHRQGNGVALAWSIIGSNTTQFNVERSYDSEFYDVISTVDCNGASTYKFKDENVYPGYIYYRISALNMNGEVEETTAPVVVRIVQRK
jgi:hypothetical protein